MIVAERGHEREYECECERERYGDSEPEPQPEPERKRERERECCSSRCVALCFPADRDLQGLNVDGMLGLSGLISL